MTPPRGRESSIRGRDDVLHVVLAFAVLLTFLYFWDRSAKKKGHQMRDPSQMGRLSKDAKRDGRAAAAGLSGDTSWTTSSR